MRKLCICGHYEDLHTVDGVCLVFTGNDCGCLDYEEDKEYTQHMLDELEGQ